MRLDRQSSAVLTRILEVFAPAEPVSLAVWLAALEDVYQRPRRALSTCLRTLQACREAAALAREVVGPDATTLAIDETLVYRLVDRWGRGRAPATVNGLLRGLRAGVNLAIRRGWLTISPFSGRVPWQWEGDGVRRGFLSRDQLGRLLDHLAAAGDWKGRRLHACASVLALAGLRRDEALGLEWADVDWGASVIAVTPKYSLRNRRVGLKSEGSAGVVPAPDQLLGVLGSWRTEVPAGCRWVFPGVSLRCSWSSGRYGNRLTESLRAAGEAVGLPDVTPHALRRSLATALRGHYGLSGECVRKLLRHSRLSHQEPYLKRDLVELGESVRGVRFGGSAVGACVLSG